MKKYCSYSFFYNQNFLYCILAIFLLSCPSDKKTKQDREQERIIVLTFDDAVKSHLTIVAPLLQKLDFGATFFISYAFMEDSTEFLTWFEVAQLYEMGFEIGNHSWTHPDFSHPANAATLEGELGLINWQLMIHGVPKPVSFAWTGNGFGAEALKVLQEQGIKFARRGMQPEISYGSLQTGPVYNPEKHHHLLIPTTRDAYPEMKLENFIDAVELAGENQIVVLQFHGVPDPVHPWVHTDPELFKKCMQYLKDNQFKVISLMDLDSYLPVNPLNDSLLDYRHVLGDPEQIIWPEEVVKTRQNSDYWIRNMQKHGYSLKEMQEVYALPEDSILNRLKRMDLPEEQKTTDRILVLPYPGGRHPRIGFHDGMLSPMRGTKASIFLPWDSEKYMVLDLPEAVFTQFGLTFLGHKHIPTTFDLHKISIKNRDWTVHPDGQLSNQWELPNQMVIGAEIVPTREEIDLTLWIYNGTEDITFTDLQTQVCIMFKGSENFDTLTNENKIFQLPLAAALSEKGDRTILTAWNRCSNAWGNPDCPCMHADPIFPDCFPGDTVRVTGKIWFYEGEDLETEISKASKKFISYNK